MCSLATSSCRFAMVVRRSALSLRMSLIPAPTLDERAYAHNYILILLGVTPTNCLSAIRSDRSGPTLSQSSKASNAEKEAFAGICGPTGPVEGLDRLTDIFPSR